MLAGTGLDVDHEVGALKAQLTDELKGRVPAPVVEREVNNALADFGQPPITQFLPILIERRVRARLGAPRSA